VCACAIVPALLTGAFPAGCASDPPSVETGLFAEGFAKSLFTASPRARVTGFSWRKRGKGAGDRVGHTAGLDTGDGMRIDLIRSFGEDSSGELHVVDYADGEIFKMVPPR
jgi:hypothetical protein